MQVVFFIALVAAVMTTVAPVAAAPEAPPAAQGAVAGQTPDGYCHADRRTR